MKCGIPFPVTYISGQYYRSMCPKCGHSYSGSLTGKRIFLGTGRRICMRCDYVFNDGSREWLSLTKTERLRYWFPAEVLLCLAFGLIFGSAASPLLGFYSLLIPVFFIALVLGPFFVIQLRRKTQSLKRSRRQEDALDLNHWLSEQAAEYWKRKRSE